MDEQIPTGAQTTMNQHPDILYHYTCEIHLGSIMRSKMLHPTYSNVNGKNVLWLTSSTSPQNLGIGMRGGILPELDKTRYRFSIRWEPHFKSWTQWCEEHGIDQAVIDLFAATAGANDAHKSWYVSEESVPIESWLSIDNLSSGQHLWNPSHI